MSVLVLDFGSQVTQLIARRVREAGVYCEIVPFNKADEALAKKPRAIILSGGPCSVYEENAPRAPHRVFEAGVPVLGICYGEMTMSAQLGGKVEGGHNQEFGRADITIKTKSPLLEGLAESGSEPVWMSHGDKITAIPPGFEVVATSESSPYAVIADEKRRFYGVQFHPEVVHTPRGATLLANFVRTIAGIEPEWNMHAFRAAMVEKIRKQVGKGKVICGLSGGVDSSVAAVLIHEAIGEQLTCIFVDTKNPASPTLVNSFVPSSSKLLVTKTVVFPVNAEELMAANSPPAPVKLVYVCPVPTFKLVARPCTILYTNGEVGAVVCVFTLVCAAPIKVLNPMFGVPA